MTIPTYERLIPFEGVHNFRDLGGYQATDGRTTRWRTLFRSGETRNMTESDLLLARDELGIKTLVDLRGQDSVSRVGTGPIADPPVKYHHIPFLTEDVQIRQLLRSLPNMGEFYVNMIERPHFGKCLLEALEIAAEPHSHPTVFHCTAGKDRSGIFAAFLLGSLGVQRVDIIEDYALSAPHMDRVRESMLSNPEGAKLVAEVPAFALESRPEFMEIFLDYVSREYGSVKGYVLAKGASESLFTALEDALLV